MVAITVNPEQFVAGPNESVRKLNLLVDGEIELQAAVKDLQAQPNSIQYLQMVVFVNGVLRTVNVATDGATPQSL